MAGVQAIVDQIINDAKEQADLILETANKQIAENEQKICRQIEDQSREIGQKAESDCLEEERRFRAIMDLESRKELLSKKRSCIDEAFRKAKQKILHLDDSGYSGFLFDLLKKCGAEGGLIWFSKRDERFFDDAFIKKAKEEINGEIEPGGVQESLESGFILVCGDTLINCSLDSVIKQARDELESDVSRILFEEVKTYASE